MELEIFSTKFLMLRGVEFLFILFCSEVIFLLTGTFSNFSNKRILDKFNAISITGVGYDAIIEQTITTSGKQLHLIKFVVFALRKANLFKLREKTRESQ
jgi:hypothetical protein